MEKQFIWFKKRKNEQKKDQSMFKIGPLNYLFNLKIENISLLDDDEYIDYLIDKEEDFFHKYELYELKDKMNVEYFLKNINEKEIKNLKDSLTLSKNKIRKLKKKLKMFQSLKKIPFKIKEKEKHFSISFFLDKNSIFI